MENRFSRKTTRRAPFGNSARGVKDPPAKILLLTLIVCVAANRGQGAGATGYPVVAI